MKNLHILHLAVCGTGLALLSSCGGLNTMLKEAPTVTYSCTPNPLEMHADSVQITIKGQYPPKYFNKKAVMEVVPVLKYEGGEKLFQSQKLQGEAVEASAKIIPFEAGGEFSYSTKVAYADEMSKSELVLRVKATVKDKSIDLPEYNVATGVIATAKLIQTDVQTIKAVDQFKRRIPESRETAALIYLINQSKVRKEEMKKDEVKKMVAYLDSIDKAQDLELVGIDLTAYASPDGPETINEKLSSERGVSANKFFAETVKKNAEASKATVNVKNTAEDWDGFKAMLQNSSLEDKELILRVLELNSDPVVREKEIKNIAKAYKKLAKDVLPKLRRSKFVVNLDKVGKSDSALLAMGTVDTLVLDIEEYLKSASLTEDFATQEKILNNAVKNFPQEWRAYNNLGYAQLKQQNVDGALASFQKAEELASDQKMVKNNIGACYQTKGDLVKAQQYYDLAAGAGKEVNFNQGAIRIKEGKYQEAVDMFGTTACFNAALAKLMNGDTNGALNTMTEAENPNNALGYYLKAIIGARTANTDLLFTNLKTAVSKDATLGAKAKKDMEFAKFFEDATFKSIVQ